MARAPVFQPEGDLTGHQRGRTRRVEDVEDGIGGEHLVYAGDGVDTQRVALPQGQEIGDVIDVGIRQDDPAIGLYRGLTCGCRRGVRSICWRTPGDA